MDHVVAKLSEIEDAAVSIITNTEIQKREYALSVKEAQQLFDDNLSEMTTRTIGEIKADAKASLDLELEKSNQNNEQTLKAFQDEYNQYHESYAAQIIKHITEV